MASLQNVSSSRVFLCYSNHNKDIARRIQADLVRDSVCVFADFTDIHPGDSLLEKIEEGLQSSDTLVLLWSKHAAISDWVSVEWQTAFKLQHRIIACVLDGTALPAIVSRLAYIDFSDYVEGYLELCGALGITPKAD